MSRIGNWVGCHLMKRHTWKPATGPYEGTPQPPPPAGWTRILAWWQCEFCPARTDPLPRLVRTPLVGRVVDIGTRREGRP
jgi:hypothetical protein